MMFRTFFERQGFLKKLYDFIFSREDQLDRNYILASRLLEAETKLNMMAGDLAIERAENSESQLQADIFQQALTNTFTEKRIQDFFDEADSLREEHDNAK